MDAHTSTGRLILASALFAGFLFAAAPSPGSAKQNSSKTSSTSVASNAATTAKIKTALLTDKVAPGMKIDVDTKNGVVTLSGQVETAAQKQRAEAIARHTQGVKKVVNHLTVKPKAP